MMKLLLHTCCGPCAIYPLNVLKKEMDVTGYFFNPNIHPYTEWKARKGSLSEFAGDTGLPMISDDEYLLEEFIRGVANRVDNRCVFCYQMRLHRTAVTALKNNFDAFSTTLLVSPYQKHDLIREVGENVARETGILFLYRDFRPGYREAAGLSKELGMYRQKYCGCIYSEKERYYRPKKRSESS